MTTSDGTVLSALRTAHDALAALVDQPDLVRRLEAVPGALAACFARAGRVLVCGNGGSACDAAHFAEELTGRFRAPPPGRAERPPLAAMACTDPGHITCVANDMGFEHVFARWVSAFARAGDVLILLSSSGNSPNLLLAADAGRSAGARVIALLGRGGGRLAGLCDDAFVVPGSTSDRIQEIHMVILHAWVEAIERHLGASGG